MVGHNIVLRRIYENLRLLGQSLAGDRIYICYCFYTVAEEIEANGKRFIRRIQFNDVAANPDFTPLEVEIVSGVLQVGEPSEQFVSVYIITGADGDNRGLVILG